MKNITSVGRVLAVMAVISSTVLAQRTSSAVQTVTFGVQRAPQSVLHNLSLVQSAVHSPDGSQASTLQNVVSTYPMKITVNAPSMPPGNHASMTTGHPSPWPSAPKTVGSRSGPSTSDSHLNAGSSYDGTALVVTLSE